MQKTIRRTVFDLGPRRRPDRRLRGILFRRLSRVQLRIQLSLGHRGDREEILAILEAFLIYIYIGTSDAVSYMEALH